ncbi:MAG TPA: hypothetical protein VJJ02_01160 [Candidatus Paceibacterota bacterium]
MATRKSPTDERKATVTPVGSEATTGATEVEMRQQRQSRVARAVVGVAKVNQRVELAVELSEKLAKSGRLTAEDRQALAQKILTAQIGELRAQLPANEKVLAELLADLDADLSTFEGAIGNFQTFTSDEQNLIDAAKKLVTSAEGHVALWKAKLASLESAWFFKASRTATALTELTSAETAVTSTKLGVAQAESQAKIQQEKRLRSAKFGELFDRFTKRIDATCKVLETSRDGAWANYGEVTTELGAALKERTASAEEMEKLDVDIEKAIQKLEQDKQQCETLTAGSSERTEMEDRISKQVSALQELQGARNEELAIFQAKERAVPELETHRDTVLAQYHVHRMNLASLIANSASWRAAFDSRIEQMKGMASIDASGKIDSVGAAIAQRGAEEAAATMIASVRQVVEMAEQHPERLADLLETQNTQHEGMKVLMARMQVAMDRSKSRDGRADEHMPADSPGTGS